MINTHNFQAYSRGKIEHWPEDVVYNVIKAKVTIFKFVPCCRSLLFVSWIMSNLISITVKSFVGHIHTMHWGNICDILKHGLQNRKIFYIYLGSGYIYIQVNAKYNTV